MQKINNQKIAFDATNKKSGTLNYEKKRTKKLDSPRQLTEKYRAHLVEYHDIWKGIPSYKSTLSES